MDAAPPILLLPRKTPRQARANATLEAIFEATLQVFTAAGPASLTMTRVAERAGVSVGTIYQYFPNKQALLYGLASRHLDTVAAEVEHACRQQHGAWLRQMAEGLVTAYWRAVTVECTWTRAVHRLAAELDLSALIKTFSSRLEAATAEMFASATDAREADLRMVNLTLLTSLVETVRTVFERDLPKPWACGVQQQLIRMCCSYLNCTSPAESAPPHS